MRTTRFLMAAASAVLLISCATATAANQSGVTSTKVNPNLITTADVDAATGMRDAYDLVQRLRPTWLTKERPAESMSGSVSGQTRAAGGGLLVYLDNARLGGLTALRDLPASVIGSLEFMDAATATATLPGVGSSSISGAIVVRSRVGR